MAKKRELVNPRDITGVLCSWSGCRTATEFGPWDLVAEGWRALVVSKYSLLEPQGVMYADVDMMLCPQHVQQLRRPLKAAGTDRDPCPADEPPSG